MLLAEPDRHRLHELLSALAEGRLDDAQSQLLGRMLVDPNAQEYYVSFGMLDACLDLAGVEYKAPRDAWKCVAPSGRRIPSSRYTPRAASLRFLRKLLHAHGDTPLATALMWMVMALCASGVVLTFAFVALIMHGVNVHVDQARADKPQAHRVGDRPDFAPAAAGELGSASSLPPVATADAARKREVAGQAATVARLVRSYDCRWAIGSHSPRPGDDLEPGRNLVLSSGLAEIMFQSGVRAVLQGPASLEIGSRTSALLRQGKLTARVEDPDAHGFVVLAPGMKYTDLGTEFGVFVGKDGSQEMQVFRGTVRAEEVKSETSNSYSEITNPSSPVPRPSALVLTAKQAMRIAAPHGPIAPMAADPARFVRAEQLAQLVADRSPEFRRWKEGSDKLRQRKDLLAYYDFQPDENDRTVLRNRAATGRQFDGAIVGDAAWSDGRCEGKRGLRFVAAGSGVRVCFPSRHEQLSAIASVYVERVTENDLQMLLGSDSWEARSRAFHWQVGSSIAGFGVSGLRGGDDYEHSPHTERFVGRWTTFACTVDAATARHAIYFNGQLIREAAHPLRGIEIGQATIGGFKPEDRDIDHPQRTLQGSMDELMIFNRALSKEEIGSLSEAIGRVAIGRENEK